MNITNIIPAWAEGLGCAVTVSDADGNILFMNQKARETFAKYGDLIGKNLFDLHNERSCGIIRHLLDTGESNTYSISKNGLKKIIHQTPWKEGDRIGGLVELSMVVPEEMPHFQR